MNVYVGNLSYEVTEEDLRLAFESFGQILVDLGFMTQENVEELLTDLDTEEKQPKKSSMASKWYLNGE